MRVPGKAASVEGTLIYPGNQGGTNWYSPSYSPHTGLFYIPAWVDYSSFYVKKDEKYSEGNQYNGGFPRSNIPFFRNMQNFRKENEGHGAIRAIDPNTGALKWEFKMNDVTDAGILTTASDIVFTGGREGYFLALDAKTGALLWKAAVGGAIVAGPITYSVEGKQYVSAAAGNALFTFALRQ
jgi:alcohol dehydrogenase (cytochrome c)